MISTLHFQLFAAHTRFRWTFMENVRRAFPHIQPGQSKVLEFLHDVGEASQHEIADACYIEPPTMSVMLVKMEADGVIVRAKAEDNNRTIRVHLTPRGRRIAKRCVEILNETEAAFFASVTPAERETLRTILFKICRPLRERERE